MTTEAQQPALAIAMQPCKSSQLAAAGYDEPSQTLAVQFVSGGTYRYAGVPAQVFTELLQAPSIGSYFAHHVRGKFTSTKQS